MEFKETVKSDGNIGCGKEYAEDMEKIIEEVQQKAFMEGYIYAIRVLQDGMPKKKK